LSRKVDPKCALHYSSQ